MAYSPQQAYNIADLRDAARRTLPKGLFEFVARGTEDEVGLKGNRAAFEAIKVRPRVLVDVSKRSTASSFFGLPARMPVAVAPTGAAGLLWFDGEIAVAKAAKTAGIPFTLSTASIISMERVADEAGGRLWFQLYMLPERRMSHQLVARAKAAGYEALVVTVDTATTPNREYNRRNGFVLPMQITRANALDVARHPGWFFNVFLRYLRRSGIPMMENYPEELRVKLTSNKPGQQPGLPKSDSLQWSDLRELRRLWTGPLMVKGVLHPDDAAMAADCGADAVIVSNHGGRNLDAAMPTIEALPAVADRVGHRLDVLVDSGFERGSDVAKALALGAKGVFVGRAPLWGVSSAGEAGVDRALAILREELDRVMAFTGSANVQALDRSILQLPAGFGDWAQDPAALPRPVAIAA
ncbi:alpha-hydroxy acid oxidase [Ramlibacter sp.]|uniref:alpha-hydroxy acid oxidase n=1 Tax=Ramlibacter sp. TaxID=1917967 RepID=UPI003D10DDE9